MKQPLETLSFDRRRFIKGSAFVGALAAAGGMAACAPNGGTDETEGGEGAEGEPEPTPPEEQIYLNSCHGNCGRNCAWDVVVRDGYVVNCMPHEYDDDPENLHRGGCMRGYLNVQRIYDADRLKYPMKRVNSKDEEEPEWEQITWDEAIDLLTEKWQSIIDEVGPTGFGLWHVYGSSAYLSGNAAGTWARLQKALGADMVVTGADMATIWAMGADSAVANSSFASLRRTETFVFWSANVAETKWIAWKHANEAKADHPTKTYSIDPNFTITAARCDVHIPINPATDGALALSLMQVIFENGWEDAAFIQERTCAPYLIKEDGTYLRESDLGVETADGGLGRVYVWDTSLNQAKPIDEVADSYSMATSGTYDVEGHTVRPALDILKERVAAYPPEICEQITGIPADTIRELAETISHSLTCIIKNNGFAHYKNSLQATLALDTLVMITGGAGKLGSGINLAYGGGPTNAEWLNTGTPGVSIPDHKLLEVVETGMLGDTPVPLKGLLTYAGNVLGSASDRGAYEKALRKLDFVAVVEIRMTDSCKFADLILPASHWWERNDVLNSGLSAPYFRIAEKAVEPPYECLSDYEISQLIAEKMGVGEYFQGTDQDQLAEALDSDANRERGCTYADLQEKKAVRMVEDDSLDPPDGTFNTENGRLNFIIDRPASAISGLEIDPWDYNLANFADTAEVLPSSPLAATYPFILLTPHTKYGTQTTFHYAPWLHELTPEPEVHINPADAEARSVEDGDYLRCFNDRGEVVVKAKYDAGIKPGLLVLYHGWSKDYFKKGHYQTLSSHANSDPVSGNASYFDVRVQAEAYKEAE